MIYVRDNLVSNKALYYKCNDDILWLKFDGQTFKLKDNVFVGLCYVVPEGSSRFNIHDVNVFDRLLDSVASIYNECNGACNLICAGDFNSRTSDNPDYVTNDNNNEFIDVLPDDYITDNFCPRFSQDIGHVNNNGVALLDFCKQTGLRILNGRTGNDFGIGQCTFVGHQGTSLIDYVLASESMFDCITSFDVGDPNPFSDHCSIHFTFSNIGTADNNSNTQNTHQHIRSKSKWKDDCKESFISNLGSRDVQSKFGVLCNKTHNSNTELEVESCINEFVTILDSVAQPLFVNNVPQCTTDKSVIETFNNPWFTDICEDKRRIFQFCLTKYRVCNSDENRVELTIARTSYKNEIRKCKRQFDIENTKNLEKCRFKNAKLYWRMLKSTSGIKTSTVSLSTFEDYFKSINNPEDQFFNPDEDIIYFNERYVNSEFQTMFHELDVQINEAEIYTAISQLQSGRSSGPDNLLNEYFIHGKQCIVPILFVLFNKIFDTGYFPDSWSEGFVIPLHKKGSKNDPNNFRGITLLSVLGKLFTRIINNRLKNWAECYNVYIEAQAGFRTHMSTVDNIFVLHGLITHMINNGKKLYTGMVDFSKAFDYVVRDNLWFKLIKLGIRGKILKVIKTMYSSIKSRVKQLNTLSNEFPCLLGVRQGECLSPFLFSMFLNDIEEHFMLHGYKAIDIYMTKLFILLYADDIVILSETAEGLQNGFDILVEYCERWKLKVNVEKTKVMVFRKAGMLPRNLSFKYNGQLIEIVKSFKYLGIVFTQGGSFHETQITLAGQAQKAIFKLNSYLFNFYDVSIKHRLQLFDKLVLPILNYSCEVWGFHSANNIERVHTLYCKKLLNVKRCTQNDFVYGVLGRRQLIVYRYFRIVKYWLKILHCESHKYVKLVYDILMLDAELHPNKTSWVILIKRLLSGLGFYEVWIAQSVGNDNVFLNILRQRLNDNFVQNWHSRLVESRRSIFYREIVVNFAFQEYFESINICKYRNTMSRLILSSHNLAVESGRWHKPQSIPFNDRKCSVCHILEDEYHLLLECSIYKDIRIKYINKYFWNRPNMFKLKELFTCRNDETIRKLSVFIYKAFEIRTLNNM